MAETDVKIFRAPKAVEQHLPTLEMGPVLRAFLLTQRAIFVLPKGIAQGVNNPFVPTLFTRQDGHPYRHWSVY